MLPRVQRRDLSKEERVQKTDLRDRDLVERAYHELVTGQIDGFSVFRQEGSGKVLVKREVSTIEIPK